MSFYRGDGLRRSSSGLAAVKCRPIRWGGWGSCGGPGRGRVQICHKGAPDWDRPRMKARNINDSPSALRRDQSLCGRFGQPAPPWASGGSTRAPARTAAAAITPLSGRSAPPPDAETYILHSRVQFQPPFSSAKRTSRVRNAHLDEQRAGDHVLGIGGAGPAPEQLR